MVFGQLVMPVQCCAGARRRAASGFLDSGWVLGFRMGSWVHDKVHVKSLDFFEPCAKAAKDLPRKTGTKAAVLSSATPHAAEAVAF